MYSYKEYWKRYYKKNKKKKKEYNKDYYGKNKEILKEKQRKYGQEHREERREYAKKYRETHEEEIRRKQKVNRPKTNKYEKDRRRKDLKFNLSRRMSSAIRRSLQDGKNGRHWESLVNYTLDDLIKRLKTTIPKGYKWQDCLDGKLHVDHKIPVSAFNFNCSGHIDFRRCWSLKNLQLLPSRENHEKYNKLIKPFQPALKIKEVKT